MANKLRDVTGMKFGEWTVLRRADHNDKYGKPLWVCRCSCGSESLRTSHTLINGQSTCCGLCKRNTTPFLVRTHSNRLYHTWSEMRRRCAGNCTNHQYYKGKGISYVPEWDDFDVFASWALANGYAPGLEIDRIDSDKEYSPENCRWVSHKKNSRNRKARSNNRTGTPGVQPRPLADGSISYRVTISSDNGKINVGTFHSLQEAVKARKAAELKYWGFNIGE